MLPFLSSGAFLRGVLVRPGSVAAMSATLPITFGVFGVPYDGAVTNRPGARFGPSRIREASYTLIDATHPHFNVSPLPDGVVDFGDLALPMTSCAAMREALERQLGDALALHDPARLHPVVLGGDHCITLSTLRAVKRRIDDAAVAAGAAARGLGCIHFDAHHDAWPDHFGEPSGHGTWVREAVLGGVVDRNCMFQIGIRSSSEEEPRTFVERNGGVVFPARELRGVDTVAALSSHVVAKIVDRLRAHGNPPTYLTFDIDCIDPSACPGTGTPEVGGLSSHQALTLVEELSSAKINLVGMDVVEVSPPYDQSEITSLAAAHLVWSYMCGLLSSRR